MVTPNKIEKDQNEKKNTNGGLLPDDQEKDGDCGMRVGKSYQAEIPEKLNHLEHIPEKALQVWAPHSSLSESDVEEYLWLARDKYGYNDEQALGMLFWHRHDMEKATRDLDNFTPFPDEWSIEDKVLFEQAFQFHGKSFHRIRVMLPDKTMAQIVKYYYLWKKTRLGNSVIDRHAKKHAARLNEAGSDINQLMAESDDSDELVKSEDLKQCSNCSVAASTLNETTKGQQCLTCFNHWKKTGSLRPTVGPMKKDKQLIKHKRRPPRGMYINHDDLVTMATIDPICVAADPNSTAQKILKHMENEVIALKRQVQINKAQVSSERNNVGGASISHLKPPNTTPKYNAKWTNDEQLLAVQGVRHYGRNFKAIAEMIGNKTENHVRSFFVTYRKRYNLDSVYKEWEEENGPVNIKMEVEETNGPSCSSTRGTPSKSS